MSPGGGRVGGRLAPDPPSYSWRQLPPLKASLGRLNTKVPPTSSQEVLDAPLSMSYFEVIRVHGFSRWLSLGVCKEDVMASCMC
ncbi:hypothetical protein Pmani_021683 [Petrolisthes manimaculis]|uniref:Uncharacterized protein n=1 Tax=Petrolisthes manimaculis TaxID=1843537 RepID=A0AAE1U1F3_9EUCA|nr:hypothetical protein Pmani_021683 [Petrolisthes manimaculis]